VFRVLPTIVILSILCIPVARSQQRAGGAAAPGPSDPTSLPVQRIGPDDLIGVAVYDSPELTRNVRVSQDGSIRLPLVKQRIRIAGLWPAEVEEAIAAALKSEQVMVDPVVTVTVAEYRSRPIKVVGAVKRPVTFQAAGEVTLLDAISRAEGLSDEAGPEILVSKIQPGVDGKPASIVQRIPVKALIDAADAESNLRLEGGEEIRVPDAGRIYVVGNVKKPGAFPIKDSAETSIMRLLALSEGLLPYSGKQAFIYRKEASGSKNEIPIDLERIIQRKAPDVTLIANDVLYIPDRTGRKSVMTALEKAMPLGAAVSSALIWVTAR
jgi:polysaccharide export outer membrane protein